MVGVLFVVLACKLTDKAVELLAIMAIGDRTNVRCFNSVKEYAGRTECTLGIIRYAKELVVFCIRNTDREAGLIGAQCKYSRCGVLRERLEHLVTYRIARQAPNHCLGNGHTASDTTDTRKQLLKVQQLHAAPLE